MRWVALVLVMAAAMPAASRHGASGITLRKRTNVNPLMAAPGTAEFDWANQYSLTHSVWTMPTSLRVTPARNGWWSGTELGVAFDAVQQFDAGGHRVTRFGDSVTLLGTRALVNGDHFDLAVTPQAAVAVHDSNGTRLGAAAIGRFDHSGHTISGTLNWTAAPRATGTTPGQLADFGTGYGWKHGRWSPHVNAVWEVAAGAPPAVALFEGIELQLSERFAIDFSMQHARAEHWFVFGLNYVIRKRSKR